MFIVKTYVSQSAIHGLGCFAGEDLKIGQAIWQFAPGIDLVIPFETIASTPEAFQEYLGMYAYISPQVTGGMVLSCDHAKFINHSSDPNTLIQGETTLASRAISKGEEITCDYRICCSDFSGEF